MLALRKSPGLVARLVDLGLHVGRHVSRVGWGVGLCGILGLSAAAGAAATVAGCDSTSTEPLIVPITGITVRAETLTAAVGCGTAPSQIFKYAVVVFGVNEGEATNLDIPLNQKKYDQFVAANVYDCFTDGTFVNLPVINGLSVYGVEVIAFDQPAYVAAGGDALIGPVVAGDLALLRSKQATYTTTCSAEQLVDVQSLAVCKPLTATGSSDGGTDGGADASDGGDASDGAPDAGADADAGEDAGL